MARYTIDSDTVQGEARAFAQARDGQPRVGAHFARAAERIVAIVGTKDITDEERILAIRHTIVALGFANSRLENADGEDQPLRRAGRQLNGPMLARLRKCAADTSSSWDGKITIYPPEAQGLVALVAAVESLTTCAGLLDPSERGTVLRPQGCGWCGGDHLADLPGGNTETTRSPGGTK